MTKQNRDHLIAIAETELTKVLTLLKEYQALLEDLKLGKTTAEKVVDAREVLKQQAVKAQHAEARVTGTLRPLPFTF